MSDFLTTITNIRNLRIACKELSLKELESAHEKLGEILQERKDEEERQNEIARKKNEALINIRAIMANANINPNDLKSLLDSEAQVSTQKRNVPPKYRFTTKDRHHCPGQGTQGRGEHHREQWRERRNR